MAFKRSLLVLLLLLLPASAWAGVSFSNGVIQLQTGVSSDVPKILRGIVDVMFEWSGLIATALFLLGAFLMVGSGGDEAYLAAGKKIMKASLIGIAFILSAWMMLSTVVYFISP